MNQKQKDLYKLVEDHYRENFTRLSRLGEDVVQEAYTRALMYWDTYDEDSDFSAWFSIILRNCIKKYKTEEKSHGAVDGESIHQSSLGAQIPNLRLRDARNLLETKPENIQKVIKLIVLDGYSYDDASYLVPEGPGHMRVMVHRFREELKEMRV